jgi:hypothetical protein
MALNGRWAGIAAVLLDPNQSGLPELGAIFFPNISGLCFAAVVSVILMRKYECL